MRTLGEPIRKTVTGKCLRCDGGTTFIGFEKGCPYWVCKECGYSWGVWDTGVHVWRENGYRDPKKNTGPQGSWQHIGDGVLLTANEKKL